MEVAAHTTWKKLAEKYSSDRAIAEKLLDELVKKYSGSGRHYHNWQHIQTLLNFSEKYGAQLVDKDVVDFAIFYHDAIYNVLRKDNEQRSAAMAADRLPKLGVPAGTIELVRIFIEATQTHQVPQGLTIESDLEFFLDFDMSVLAADRELYRLYKEQVRKEYHLIPAALYRPGRKKFLQNCLQSRSIFKTTEFKSRYEVQARANLQWELETDYRD
jgi:predicted metal-dependent HD superfamily phosphohydrolase